MNGARWIIHSAISLVYGENQREYKGIRTFNHEREYAYIHRRTLYDEERYVSTSHLLLKDIRDNR